MVIFVAVIPFFILISLLVYFDYMEAFKLLKYIGFDGALNESFIITK